MIYLIPDVLTHCSRLKQVVTLCGIDDQFNIYLQRGDRDKSMGRPSYHGNSRYPFSNYRLDADGLIYNIPTAEREIGGQATETLRLIAQQLTMSDTVDKSLMSAIVNVVGNTYPKFDISRMKTGQLKLENCEHLLRHIFDTEDGKTRKKYEQRQRVEEYLNARKARKPKLDYVEVLKDGQIIAKLRDSSANRLSSFVYERKTILGTPWLMTRDKYIEMMSFVDQHDLSGESFRLRRHGRIEILTKAFERDRSTLLKRLIESAYIDPRDGMIQVRFRVNNTQLV